MSRPFDRLGERLLEAGIAPRNVHRYLAELEDHLADLTNDCHRQGIDRREAADAALARIGSMDTLARAMMAQPALKAWVTRAPWAAFVVGPLLGWFAACVACMVALVAIVQMHRAGVGAPAILPVWFDGLRRAITILTLYIFPLLTGWLIAGVALRQRVSTLWPILGLVAIAVLGGGAQIDLTVPTVAGTHGELSVCMSLIAPYAEFANGVARVVANLLLTVPLYLILRQRAAATD
jgi:hypothetical protein